MHIPKHVMIPRESDNGDNGKFASRLLRRKTWKLETGQTSLSKDVKPNTI